MNNLTRTYVYYYFLKYYKEEDNFFIKKLLYHFDKVIPINMFLFFLIENKKCTNYFLQTYFKTYSPKNRNILTLKSFIKEIDNLDEESIDDIIFFYISYFLCLGDEYLDKIAISDTEIFDELMNMCEFIESKSLKYVRNKEECKDCFETNYLYSSHIDTNIKNLNFFISTYVLCIEEDCEDDVLYNIGNGIACSINNKDTIEDLLDTIEALATDDLLEETVFKLKSMFIK